MVDPSSFSEDGTCSFVNRAMKYRDLIKRIETDGWRLDRTVGSHMQFRHPTKPGTVTIAAGGKLGRDVLTGTLNSVLRQAGLK
ncbi:MAG TPA: type II toxin-antitoxin system HicA family toxin [Tepidisphaeraceae bacterium]|jgi:predicted RNA binding protein YcfA (HicA-like mRNA interferase family)